MGFRENGFADGGNEALKPRINLENDRQKKNKCLVRLFEH